MSFLVFVAPFFRWPFTVLFFFTSRSFLAPYRVRLLESVSLIHRGSAFSSHLECRMRKPSKLVCITDGRPKQDTDVESSIPIRGEAIGTLHCERALNRIDFFLTPLIGTRKAKAERDPRKSNLTVLPSPSMTLENDGPDTV